MDALVELTTLGAAGYGGDWSACRARKAIELIDAPRCHRSQISDRCAAEEYIRRRCFIGCTLTPQGMKCCSHPLNPSDFAAAQHGRAGRLLMSKADASCLDF